MNLATRPLPAHLAEPLFAAAFAHPEKVALVCEDEVLRYGELAGQVRQLASALSHSGVRAGDVIGVALPNCPAFVVLMFAAATLGVALAPINTTLPADAVQRGFAVAGARHWVVTEAVLGVLREAGAAASAPTGVVWALEGEEGLDAHLVAAEDAPPPAVANHLDAPFILTMTSGSTGDPKPIILSQRSKWMRAASAQQLYGIGPNDVVLAATPLYHSLAERLVLMPLMVGATAVLMRRFTPAHWLKTVETQRVSFSIAVSSQLAALVPLLRAPNAAPSLRCLVSSSAALPDAVKRDLVADTHFDFHECYGTSEVAIVSNLHVNARLDKLSTVGSAIPGVDIGILDDQRQFVGPGVVGEIAARTPLAFAGYQGPPERTAEAMHDGYFCTGDFGRLDADGFLTYLGRKKELIISGGINIYPADVESAVRGFPGLRDAVACGVADAGLGEVVGLALAADADALDLRALRHHCARHLADFQQPRHYQLLPEFPLNALGKIDRRALKARFHTESGAS